MQNVSVHPDRQHLNRLALQSEMDVRQMNPYAIMQGIFGVASVQQMKELLDSAIRAALATDYEWTNGTPGHLLYFFERLETLVEAAWLCAYRDTMKLSSQQPKKIHGKKMFKTVKLPCALSTNEISDPLVVIKDTFSLQPLKKWKQTLYLLLEAGMSDYSAVDNMPPKDIYNCVLQLHKLIEAGWVLVKDM